MAAHQLASQLDAAAAPHPGGWQASWRARRVYGYPFRLDVDVDDLKLADPSGWGLAAPSVKAEAYLFAPTRWIAAFPTGLTFTRPDGGPVDVRGHLIRFSLNSWDEHPPRLSLEGEDLTFTTPGLDTKPFALERAANVQLYTRAGPSDQGALLLTVKDGVAAPATWLAAVGQDKPVSLILDATFTHASAIHGLSVRDAARAWAHAGGALDVQNTSIQAPNSGFDALRGRLTLTDDGSLTGALDGSARDFEGIMTRGLSEPRPPGFFGLPVYFLLGKKGVTGRLPMPPCPEPGLSLAGKAKDGPWGLGVCPAPHWLF
jgi:hypothetical protein